MRCKIHDTDLTSIIGVCASCLRERLSKLIPTQAQTQTQAQLGLPRSTSPYNTTYRKSNSVTNVQRRYNKPHLNHSISEKRFFNSPQIAIVAGGCIGGTSGSSSSSNGKKPPSIRFSSISNIFRFNSRNDDRNGNVDAYSNHRVSVSSCNESTGVARKQRCVSVSDRGMSPVRKSDDEDDSPYESAESCKRTPSCAVVRRGGGGGQKSVVDLMFCPLVSANSNRLVNVKEKGKVVVDGGESRVPVTGSLSCVKSFSGNRSRKIADFGRADPNR